MSKNYTDEDILVAVKYNKSLSGVLKQLGLVLAGGNFANLKRNLQRLNADTNHWTGKGWTKEQRLKNWSEYSKSSSLKPHLIRLRGHRCESCALKEWLQKPITLEIHHVDGDRTNNVESNLQLLCPNCHSYTETWRRSTT
jgi:hypothetical protein